MDNVQVYINGEEVPVYTYVEAPTNSYINVIFKEGPYSYAESRYGMGETYSNTLLPTNIDEFILPFPRTSDTETLELCLPNTSCTSLPIKLFSNYDTFTFSGVSDDYGYHTPLFDASIETFEDAVIDKLYLSNYAYPMFYKHKFKVLPVNFFEKILKPVVSSASALSSLQNYVSIGVGVCEDDNNTLETTEFNLIDMKYDTEDKPINSIILPYLSSNKVYTFNISSKYKVYRFTSNSLTSNTSIEPGDYSDTYKFIYNQVD